MTIAAIRCRVMACAVLLCWAGWSTAGVPLPGGRSIDQVDFERHVMGIFSKAGCNNGSCHGSFQGKNGFRLSLFGLEPDKDFQAVTRDNLGRRIDPVRPDESLLLTKAIGSVQHDGGTRFGRDSWQYQLLRAWIADGARHQSGSGAVRELILTPGELAFKPRQEQAALTVTARFADGSQEVVTPLCDFRIQDDSVAQVSPTGLITARQPGDTAVVVSYRGKVRALRVLVPAPSPKGFVYPKLPVTNDIDKHVFAKLRRLNMAPSDLASDQEFLRRLTIDTIGCLPTPEEIRAFLADSRPDKRDRKIDELLAHPLHAALWATKLSDITGNNTDDLENPVNMRGKWSQMWHEWLRKRVADNVPYDEIVRGILVATSRSGRPAQDWLQTVKKIEKEASKNFETSYADEPSLDLFWRRRQNNIPIEQWGEKTAAAFLGVRLECAQCHKHPTDRWTQADYRAYANIFGQIAVGISPEARAAIDAENKARRDAAKDPKKVNQIVQVRELFLAGVPAAPERGKRGNQGGGGIKSLPHPETGEKLAPKTLGGPEIAYVPSEDMREHLFQWMRSPDNPFFARSFVNRVWAHYFGVGIVDPVDDFSQANPPTNPALLDALAEAFIKSGFDIRALERLVLQSRTYQLASKPNATNAFDRNNFSHAFIRPLMAEVVVDVLNGALGVEERYGSDAPSGRHMVEVGPSRLQNSSLMYVLRTFGRPPRTTACDCERAMDPALPQTLIRMTDPAILSKLQDNQGRVARLAGSKMPLEEACRELFLAALSREPNADEMASVRSHIAAESDRREVLTDVMWALVNTREFILNH